MENASKALIMAGGVLLTMLVVSLVIYAWNVFSGYYKYQDSLENIDDVAKFNLQFSNYDRQDVSGYEIISLTNKVADYNSRYSNLPDNKSNIHTNPISITIRLIESGYVNNVNALKQKLTYSGDRLRLFTNGNGIYIQSGVRNDIESTINIASTIEAQLGDEKTASKVARSMDALLREDFSSDPNVQNDEKKGRVELYNSIIPSGSPFKITVHGTDYVTAYNEMQNKIKGSNGILAYYEYYQFKKGIFKCSDVQYDDSTTTGNGNGKIRAMTFIFTGKIE